MRKNLLITLSNINYTDCRKSYNKENIQKKIMSIFESLNVDIKIIIISIERHKNEKDYHFHIGINHVGFDRNIRFNTVLRKEFKEFEGRALDIQYRKSINPIIAYLLKEDSNPFLYGISLDNCLDIKKAYNTKKSPSYILNLLKEKKDWNEVLEDETLSPRLLFSYHSMKKLFNDFKSKENSLLYKDNKEFLKKNIVSNNLNESLIKFNKAQLKVLNWFYNNLNYDRIFRQEQLLVLGVTTTGKSTFIRNIIRALDLKVYEPSSEDFSHYIDNSYDLILIDEFDYKKFNRSFLLKLLEGSNLIYTGKYQECKIKRNNLPVILICNPTELPPKEEKWEPFFKRLEIIYFEKTVNYKKDYNNEDIINFMVNNTQINITINNTNNYIN